jgi:histidyl-tRNA synthetase
LKDLCNEDEFKNGVEELKEVLKCLSHLKESMKLSFDWTVDLKIIRGLDYYTGTIFEANFKSDE